LKYKEWKCPQCKTNHDRDINTAINIKNDLAIAWYLRGLAYFRLNKMAEAEENITQARKYGFKESTIESPNEN